MTKRTKRALFYASFVVFVFISYVAILYAQGYKFDFANTQFYKTGTLYLKVNTDANVYLNDNPIGSTAFFSNSFSKNGLMPKNYVVRVTKDSYSVWQKQFSIQEGLVTEFPHILILPQSGTNLDSLKEEINLIFNLVQKTTPTPSVSPSATAKATPKPKTTPSPTPSPTPQPFFIENKILYQTVNSQPGIISRNVIGFAVSDNEDKILWWTPTGEVWAYWFNDTNYQPFHKKGDMELVNSYSAGAIKSCAWYDNDHIVVNLGSRYEILELDNRGGENIIKI